MSLPAVRAGFVPVSLPSSPGDPRLTPFSSCWRSLADGRPAWSRSVGATRMWCRIVPRMNGCGSRPMWWLP